VALTRPKTKAATRSSTNEQTATRSTSSEQTVTLAEALDRWYTSLAAGESVKSPKTLKAYRYGTDKLVAAVGATRYLHSVQAEDVEALLAELKARGITPGGRALVFRPIRTFFRWCVKRGLLASSPVEGMVAPKAPATPVEFVTDAEFAAILATTETRSRWAFRAYRDRAILLMLATTGARLSEVADLKLSDLDLAGQRFIVKGKGGKDRVLPLLPDTLAALQRYLDDHRPRSPFSGITDALWLAPRGALTSNGIAQLVAERGKAAGLKRRVHPHELRHRAIAGWLRQGMPDSLVMALSGHSTHAMLNRYGAHTRQEDAIAMLRGLAG
jgi:site-specific recombinase XerD